MEVLYLGPVEVYLDYDPKFKSLCNVLHDPLQLRNLGFVKDLYVHFDEFLLQQASLSSVATQSRKFYRKQLLGQKNQLIKKMPYITNLVNIVSSAVEVIRFPFESQGTLLSL